MTLRSTCGIVLRIAEHGESDKLVTLCCPDLGRVTGIAKGARKSKHRFVNKLEEFSHLHFYYRAPKGSTGLFLISEAELLAAHLSLRTDVQKYSAAMYLCELILRFTRDHDPDPQLYALLKWALAALHYKKTPLKIITLAHLHLLATVGYRPELSQCTGCRQAIGPSRTYMFLPGSGALLCSTCSPQREAALPAYRYKHFGSLPMHKHLTLIDFIACNSRSRHSLRRWMPCITSPSTSCNRMCILGSSSVRLPLAIPHLGVPPHRV